MPRLLLILILALLVPLHAARADYAEGERAYTAKQWVAAIAVLRPLVDAGDERAAFLLGKMYLDGNGVIPNAVEAMGLYRKAAAKGNTDAMISIGAIYQGGIGFKKNAKTANEWYARAARIGSQYAAFIYGVSLFQGDVTEKTDFKPDPAAAYKWFRVAATTGNYPKVKEAAEAAATAASNRLKGVEITRIDNEVLQWQATPNADLGPLPELTP